MNKDHLEFRPQEKSIYNSPKGERTSSIGCANGLTRRSALGMMAGAVALNMPSVSYCSGDSVDNRRTSMGLVVHSQSIRRRHERSKREAPDLFEPMRFLEHCLSLGVGGMQARLGVLDEESIRKLRETAERHEFYIEAIVSPPTNADDLDRFDAEIRSAKDASARAVRTVIMPGRRYERFASLDEFREFASRGKRMLELAIPVVEEYQIPLAVENHKDQRIDERIALFEQLDCEFVGACIDTGNSIALLDDPYEAVEALTPFAFSVHLKDQALKMESDGFLLGDVPLGQGSLDLQRMVREIQSKKPEVRFTLELITRDPLRVPCLTEEYWATLPNVPGRDLARTLRLVQKNAIDELQSVSSRPLSQQLKLEDDNVEASIEFAATELGI